MLETGVRINVILDFLFQFCNVAVDPFDVFIYMGSYIKHAADDMRLAPVFFLL